jgi:hypothetical protein
LWEEVDVRDDMARVLIERPRWNSAGAGRTDRREWQRVPIEDWPARQGMKRRCKGGTKGFSDLLGPLRRFLGSNVGRPWDKVYSEICAGLRAGFPTREHFLTHVFQFVERHAVLVDGVPHHASGYAIGRPIVPSRWGSFYVCPKTGLLREAKARRKGTRR